MRWTSTTRSPETSMTRCLPRRRMPSIVLPSRACKGGSDVLSALMPGAIVDSISAPASASSNRRAVISTSGSSGTPTMLREPLELPGTQQHDQLAAAAVNPQAGDAALLHIDLRAGQVVHDLREVRLVADDEDPLVGVQKLQRVVGGEAHAQRRVLHRLAAERLVREPSRVAGADLRRGVDGLERDGERR